MPKPSDEKPAKSPRPAKPAKPAAPAAAAAAKPARAASAAAPKPAARSAKPATTDGYKLRDLVDSVAAATGAKKPDAKAAVEATLAALATALKAGSDMTLPPLGKIRVVKLAEKSGATMMTLKLRHGGGEKAAAKPLADDGEDG